MSNNEYREDQTYSDIDGFVHPRCEDCDALMYLDSSEPYCGECVEEEPKYPRMFDFDSIWGCKKGKKLRMKIFKTNDYKIILPLVYKIMDEMSIDGQEIKCYNRDFVPYAVNKHGGIIKWVEKLKKEEEE